MATPHTKSKKIYADTHDENSADTGAAR